MNGRMKISALIAKLQALQAAHGDHHMNTDDFTDSTKIAFWSFLPEDDLDPCFSIVGSADTKICARRLGKSERDLDLLGVDSINMAKDRLKVLDYMFFRENEGNDGIHLDSDTSQGVCCILQSVIRDIDAGLDAIDGY